MLTWLNIVLIVFTVLQECQSRSVSVIVRHRQTFSVREVAKRSYIRLADKHEDELQLAMYQPLESKKSEKGNGTDGHMKHSTDKHNVKDNVIHKIAKFVPDSEEHIFGGYKDEELPYDDSDLDDDDHAAIDVENELNESDSNGEDNADDNIVNKRDDFYEYDDGDLANQNQGRVKKILNKMYEADLDDDDVISEPELDDDDIDNVAEQKLSRHTREAHEQWKNSGFGSAAAKSKGDSKSGKNVNEPDDWETITDEELAYGKNFHYKETAEFLGITLLSVAGFAFIGICFIRDPVACVFAFGTGCPCCIIFCPCIRAFTDKYLDSKRMIRESMNKYMPGVIVNEDGSMEFYEPTPEEVEILHEILEELQG